MIFHRLELENFRQFVDRQTIEFATDPHRNVTVVHGYNGSGKTTLLNAFTWFLFRETSPDFLDPDRLASESSWAALEGGEVVRTVVKGQFEHDGRTYLGERVRIVEKLDGAAQRVKQEGTLTLQYMNDDGSLRDVRNPEDVVQQILPKVLSPFFFFNGERIERLANPSAYEQVERGVKVLLDILLLDRAITHLRGRISDQLRNEVAENAGEEGKRLRAERDALSTEKDDVEGQLEQLQRNRAALYDDLAATEAKLRAQPELAKYQMERDKLKESLSRTKEDLAEVRKGLERAVSKDGYLVLGHAALERAVERFDEAHQEGELPPPLKKQFVEELLKKEECICERKLTPGTDARAAVEAWRARSRSDEFAQVATVTRAAIRNSLYQRLEDFWQTLDDLQRRRAELEKHKRESEERRSEISRLIGDAAPEEDFQRLESHRTRTERSIRDLDIQEAEYGRTLEDIQKRIQQKDHEIRQTDRAGARGQLAQRRLSAVQNVADALEKIRALRQENTRVEVSEKLNEVWNATSIKDYHAHLDDNYRLRLMKEVDGQIEPVRGASTGEKQVLSLAFVASLAQKARDLHESRSEGQGGLFSGGKYPLVMDSPFGSLEVDYRSNVARWVPQLAPQIVVMVSQTQWRGEVAKELQGRVGRSWVLECHTPKQSSKTIVLDGREHPYVAASRDGYERTVINEVSN